MTPENVELILNRPNRDEAYTGGLLSQIPVNEQQPAVIICHTLEDPIRVIGPNGEGKIKGRTAIPAGRYRVILSYSNRFKRILPELINVPHFVGIRIHVGNDTGDTDGCILVGSRRVKGILQESRLAFERLMTILEIADRTKSKVFITIVNS